MNTRVVFSLVLALIWLVAGLYFLLGPKLEFAFGDSRLMGWLALLLMLWNILRAGLVWSRPKRTHGPPF